MRLRQSCASAFIFFPSSRAAQRVKLDMVSIRSDGRERKRAQEVEHSEAF